MTQVRTALASAALFFLVALKVSTDFGPNFDAHKNYAEGEAQLRYLKSGHVDLPILVHQAHGALAVTASAVSRQVFHSQLGWLGEEAARRLPGSLGLALTVFVFAQFMGRAFGSAVAFWSSCLLVLFPESLYEFGANQKDGPMVALLAAALFSFYGWAEGGRTRSFYLTCLLLGMAISIKFYSLIAVAISAPLFWRSEFRRSLGARHLFYGVGLALLVGLYFYSPAFWASADKPSMLRGGWEAMAWMFDAEANHLNWNFDTPLQVLLKTPVFMLAFSLCGLVAGRDPRPLSRTFMSSWLVWPLLIPCLPFAKSTDGLRLCFLFIVPWAYFASLGVMRVSVWLGERLRLSASRVSLVIAFVGVSLLAWAGVSTHPFQTLYFNELIGGLAGAAQARVPFAFDFRGLSYANAARWLRENGRPEFQVMVVKPYPQMPEIYYRHVWDGRVDTWITAAALEERIRNGTLPVPVYVVIAPGSPDPSVGQANAELSRSSNAIQAFSVKRQKGDIISVFALTRQVCFEGNEKACPDAEPRISARSRDRVRP